MSDRQTVAHDAAANLRTMARHLDQLPVMVGFDGMVDSIIDVVDMRPNQDEYLPVQTIERLAEKIAAAAGKSSNYELVVKQEKLGGNGPIMANALIRAGLPVTYVGGIGYPDIHPAYQEMADGCEACLPVADPGYTDALEFEDGKLMLGKHENTRLVNRENIRKVIGDERMQQIIRRARLVAMVNWTMLLHTTDIWRYMIESVFPQATQGRTPDDTRIFIDLTDPEKRTREDLREALEIISGMESFARVSLGLNLKEATQVAQVLGVSTPEDPEQNVQNLAADIRASIDLTNVIVHPRTAAGGARRLADGSVETAYFVGPFVKNPKLSTGAGDNFNAGYCLGLLADMPLEQCLCVGTATSGAYVRNAQSPTLEMLADFCENLPESE